MAKKIKRIGLLTSGGDACGMNATIRAVTRYAIYNDIDVLGFYEGYKGLIRNDFKMLDLKSVGGIIDRGGTFLYSARSEKFKTEQGLRAAVENISRDRIDGMVVIGGDGSFRGAHELHERGVKIVGIPATIDNDIAGTDYSIGFDTALNVIISIISKIRDTASSHDRLFVVEVMGRRSGMIAVHAGIACAADYVLIPEIRVDLAKIANDIKNHREGKRHILVLVAEGAAKATEVAASIKLLAGHEVRVSVLGHIQRGGFPSALDRILAAKFGRFAIDLLLKGKSDCITAIKGNKIRECSLEYTLENKKEIKADLYELAHILAL